RGGWAWLTAATHAIPSASAGASHPVHEARRVKGLLPSRAIGVAAQRAASAASDGGLGCVFNGRSMPGRESTSRARRGERAGALGDEPTSRRLQATEHLELVPAPRSSSRVGDSIDDRWAKWARVP